MSEMVPATWVGVALAARRIGAGVCQTAVASPTAERNGRVIPVLCGRGIGSDITQQNKCGACGL